MRRRRHGSLELFLLSNRPLAVLPLCLVFLQGCAPDADESPPPIAAGLPSQQLFAERAAALGVDFEHHNGMSGRHHMVEILGAGAALFDYDRDGDLDLYMVQGGPLPADSSEAPIDRLYRNGLTDGALSFDDVTAASRIVAGGYGIGVATGDYDGDGWTDLYLTNYGPNQLWRNRGDGTFEEVGASSRTDDPRWSAAASFGDFDGDGLLDLYVANYVGYYLDDPPACFDLTGAPDYCGPGRFEFQSDRLYRNRGDGTFDDLSVPSGVAAVSAPGLGSVAADFDGDGRVDVYVANDAQPNQLWINQGGLRFRDEGLLAGCALNAAGEAEGSMGIDAEDVDDDGDLDLFMTHLDKETNTLFRNEGSGGFRDVSNPSGLGLPSQAYTGFGTVFLDVDNDGRQDVFVANGAVNKLPDQVKAGDPLPLKQPDQLFLATGPGAFRALEQESVPYLRQRLVSRGVAVGDLDNDGDADLVVTHNAGSPAVLINLRGQAASWVGAHLVEGKTRRDAIGAVARLVEETLPPLRRRARTDGSYASARDPRLIFGLADSPLETVAIEVRWPDGAVERFERLGVRRYHELRRGEGSAP